MEEIFIKILPAILVICGFGVLYFAFKKLHNYRLIADTPTSKIRSMAIGITEICGSAFAKDYIITPFSQTNCVHYSYEIKEYRRHTTTDSKGRTHTTYSWDTIATGSKSIAFFTKDDTGEALINPTDAEFHVDVKRVFLQRAGMFGGISSIISALTNWGNNQDSFLDVKSWNLEPLDPKNAFAFRFNSVGDRKYYEYFIEPNESIYVLGTAANDRNAPNNVVILKGENEPTFIISNKSEQELLKSLKWAVIGFFIGSIILIVIGVIIFLNNNGIIIIQNI